MSDMPHPNYRKIYYLLLALLAISVAGPFLGIKWVTLITAFGIAIVKARLVVQNFMHLKWDWPTLYFLIGPAFILGAMMAVVFLPDSLLGPLKDGNEQLEIAAELAKKSEAPH